MGTDERCMAWINDEIGRAVGLPQEIGGIPLDEIGATGSGLRASVEAAMQVLQLRSQRRARIVIQGFGSVGKHARAFSLRKARSWSRHPTRAERFTIQRELMLRG